MAGNACWSFPRFEFFVNPVTDGCPVRVRASASWTRSKRTKNSVRISRHYFDDPLPAHIIIGEQDDDAERVAKFEQQWVEGKAIRSPGIGRLTHTDSSASKG
jgi:hypothetical protein